MSRRYRRQRRPPEDVQPSFEVTRWLWVINSHTWTDEDIDALQYFLLQTSLQELFDRRTSAKVRAECWDWVLDDVLRPFSFRACSEACGYDTDRLRSALTDLRRRLQKAGYAEAIDIKPMLQKEVA